jgi:hypothetical protein
MDDLELETIATTTDWTPVLPACAAANCKVCLGPHDEEIHAATVSVRLWFRSQVTKYFYEDAVLN